MLLNSLAAATISKLVFMPLLPGFDESQICGISSDGKAVVGYQTMKERKTAFVWDATRGLRNLEELSWNMWRAGMGPHEYDEKGDPIDRVGLKPNQIRWARTVAFLAKPKVDLKNFRTPWFLGSSADGKTLFGNGISSKGEEGFVWTQASGAVGIGDLPGGFFYSRALALSPEGRWAAGCSKSFDGLTAVLWSKATGINPLRFKGQGKAISRALCASLDAKTVGGEAETSIGFQAVLWLSRGEGELVAQLAGSKLPSGWVLSSVECVSDDGMAIAGTAQKDGKNRNWVAWLE